MSTEERVGKRNKILKENYFSSLEVLEEVVNSRKMGTFYRTGEDRFVYRDKNGTIYRAELYDKNDILLYYYIYEYNENGNSISVLGYDADGNPLIGD